METRRCHAVLRCANDSCEANFWDRDVNAAINMVELLKSELCGDKRPVRIDEEQNSLKKRSPSGLNIIVETRTSPPGNERRGSWQAIAHSS